MIKIPFRRRFTLLELLIVIAIISILSSMFLPVLNKAKEKSRQITCLNGQKQLGAAIMMYAGDNNDMLPNSVLIIGSYYIDWGLQIAPYCSKWSDPVNARIKQAALLEEAVYSFPNKVFFCPSGLVKKWTGGLSCFSGNYTINYSIMPHGQGYSDAATPFKLSQLRRPTLTGVLWDGLYAPVAGWFGAIDNSTTYTTAGYCHQRMLNILYADGHAQQAKYSLIIPIAYGGNGDKNNLY
jgi:prepilin-type N-terminal cleavage/methylation domain-containing protein/prepilin-type processing-associated H-X9-DG protein